MADRLDDVPKVAGERGLVRSSEDGRARLNEGKAMPRPPAANADGTENVEAYKGNPDSPEVATHWPYVDPVNSAASGPTRNAQVPSDDADIEAVYGVGKAEPRPPVDNDGNFAGVETYKGNAASPEIRGHAPFVDPVNSADSAPGNGTDVVDEGAPTERPAVDDDGNPLGVEHYKGNANSPEPAIHAPYVDPVNDASGPGRVSEDTFTDASADE